MEVATALYTVSVNSVITLFTLFKLLYTALTVAYMPIYGWMEGIPRRLYGYYVLEHLRC